MHPKGASESWAVLMLLVACALWGMSFNWNKQAQAEVGERMARLGGAAELETLGPAGFLAVRFVIASVLWAMIFPRSLVGWNRRSLVAGALAGALLSCGMLLQHYGLARTSESLSAFLTSLTVIFTPLIAAGLLGQRVSGMLWVSIAFAMVGVALITMYREEGRFDLGALLGLMCAIVFSGHILVVDHFGKLEESTRFTLLQFLVASAVFTIFLLIWSDFGVIRTARALVRAVPDGTVTLYLGLTVVFATLITFGLMFRYQPQTSATRAALTYLTEPLFATAYAWVAAGVAIEPMALVGGGLIILGNAFAEVFSRRRGGGDMPVTQLATESDK